MILHIVDRLKRLVQMVSFFQEARGEKPTKLVHVTGMQGIHFSSVQMSCQPCMQMTICLFCYASRQRPLCGREASAAPSAPKQCKFVNFSYRKGRA